MLPQEKTDALLDGIAATAIVNGVYLGLSEPQMRALEDTLAIKDISLKRADVLVPIVQELSANDFDGNNVKFYLFCVYQR